MNQIAFLIDEDIPESVLDAIHAVEPSIVVFKIGVHANVPAKGTQDPDLLVFAEKEGFVVVSFDKRTMPQQLTEHIAAGRHLGRIFVYEWALSLRWADRRRTRSYLGNLAPR